MCKLSFKSIKAFRRCYGHTRTYTQSHTNEHLFSGFVNPTQEDIAHLITSTILYGVVQTLMCSNQLLRRCHDPADRKPTRSQDRSAEGGLIS